MYNRGMHRFYLSEEISGDKITVAEAGQLHHLRDVLRLSVGDEVAVFDERENEYRCVIAELRKNRAVLEVKGKKRAGTEKVEITIACAIPKKDGMDGIVDSLTQLGVDVIIPMETERVIVRLDDEKKEARLRRWRKIARNAAEQSQRSRLPQVEPVADFAGVVARSRDYDLRLIPALAGERQHISGVLIGSKPKSILVLIGPEGDFTPEEVGLARSAGFIPVSLGENVLRVAVAAGAVAACIRLSYAA